jgi:hypothetical protein
MYISNKVTKEQLHKKSSSGTQKVHELWMDQKQRDYSDLVQSKGTKTIYINSIRIIV